jgi:hypothetical protein
MFEVINNPQGIGVLGFGATGGQFITEYETGKGVYSEAMTPTGNTYGGYFLSHSVDGTGVYGEAAALTGQTYGGIFSSQSPSGAGVCGFSFSNSGDSRGGYFVSQAPNGEGVYGYASATSGETIGVCGASDSPEGKGVKGRGRVGVYGISGRKGGKGVKGVAKDSTCLNCGVYGKTNSPCGYGVYSEGNMKVDGDFEVTGTKSAVVKLDNGEGLRLYAVESSENWFEDFGSSKLTHGKAVVKIDPTFVQTVNTNIDYHVFLTPRGNCQGLYVTSLGQTSFEVKELNEGKSDISFSYRIVAKRIGFENQRLARISKEQMTAIAESELDENEDATEVALNKKRFDKMARLRVAK